jgi:hypothetical protein
VRFRAGLDTEAREKSFAPAGDRTLVFQSVIKTLLTDLQWGRFKFIYSSGYEISNLTDLSPIGCM